MVKIAQIVQVNSKSPSVLFCLLSIEAPYSIWYISLETFWGTEEGEKIKDVQQH